MYTFLYYIVGSWGLVQLSVVGATKVKAFKSLMFSSSMSLTLNLQAEAKRTHHPITSTLTPNLTTT